MLKTKSEIRLRVLDFFLMNTTLLFMGIKDKPLIILLLFGGKKIPELMKGLGKGVKNFKDGMNGVEENLKDSADKPENKEK